MIIRRISPDDSFTAMTELLHSAYARLGAMGFNYTAVDQTEEVTRKRAAGGTCLVAVAGGQMIGTITFYEPGRLKGCLWYQRPDVAVIGQFGVRPDHQGRGIGTGLLREAEMLGISTGSAELALDTSEGADHLTAWYRRKGFRIIQYAQWSGKKYRSVIMSKKLKEQDEVSMRTTMD
jgi:GNAT superfamily N-acetyltransferase